MGYYKELHKEKRWGKHSAGARNPTWKPWRNLGEHRERGVGRVEGGKLLPCPSVLRMLSTPGARAQTLTAVLRGAPKVLERIRACPVAKLEV